MESLFEKVLKKSKYLINSSMGFHVLAQIGAISTGKVALRTAMRFFASVHCQVGFQSNPLSEGFITQVTQVQLFPGMDFIMEL